MKTTALSSIGGLISLLLSAAAPSPASAEPAPSAAGRYAGQLLGMRFEVVLRPDGSASIAGEDGRWSQRGQEVTLVVGGGSDSAMLEGKNLVVNLYGARIVLERQDVAPAGGPPAAAQARPGPAASTASAVSGGGCGERLVAVPGMEGPKVNVPNLGVRLHLPRGWSGKWEEGKDRPYYHATGPSSGEGGFITVVLTFLADAQKSKSIEDLIDMDVPADAERLESRRFSVAGNCGGWLIFRAEGLEQMVTAIQAGDWLYLGLARYQPSAAEVMRPSLQTMFATAILTPPARNAAMEKRIQGCWKWLQVSNNYNGVASAGAQITLAADGSFTWMHHSYVSVGATGIYRETQQGQYRVVGDYLLTARNEGGSRAHPIEPAGVALLIGGKRYIPCSPNPNKEGR